MSCQPKYPKKLELSPPFDLISERLGALPLINEFLQRAGIEDLLEKFVPTLDKRVRLPYAKALGVLLRSIILEREPVYRHQDLVRIYTPGLFGIGTRQAQNLNDDQIGRALDALFLADRGTLLTQLALSAIKRFEISTEEIHNDSTSIKLSGAYREAKGRKLRGKQALRIEHGYSKDKRADLKQLLFILSASADGGVPIQFRSDSGAVNDSVTHIQTWETLRKIAGKADFLYVADSKLCTHDNMMHIDTQGGRLVTVLPRSRKEDRWFRQSIQTQEIPWQVVRDRPNPRSKYAARDRWSVYRPEERSLEGWPLTWVCSSLLALKQKNARMERLHRAVESLEQLQKKLQGPRTRIRTRTQLGEKIAAILGCTETERYLHIEVSTEDQHRFRQESKGRPGKQTRYRRVSRERLSLSWQIDQEAIRFDEKSDGMYPLLTNDESLSPREVFEAHKRQPQIEKRFQQIKKVHQIAPVFLKNEGRIEAYFFLVFIALLVTSVMEREIHKSMKAAGIPSLPIYPEERKCSVPTHMQILRLFREQQRHRILKDGDIVQEFPPKLNDIQAQVLALLHMPKSAYS